MALEDLRNSVLDGGSLLITGGTGSLGRRLVDALLRETRLSRVVVLSRDEFKQHRMRQSLGDDERVQFVLGDVRDRGRLDRSFDGMDFVIHAAALKHIAAAEYNPLEFVKTNIHGAQNVIDAAIDRGVRRVVALSTDKASSPVNLYGGTKLVSDRLFVSANAGARSQVTRFAVVRNGNILGSRGSVVAKLRELRRGETFRMTDACMTRFWITADHGARFVIQSLEQMTGGETFVPKIPSMKLGDLVAALAPEARVETVGARPGEKLHEEMISYDEGRRTVDRGDHYVIRPEIVWGGQRPIDGQPVPAGFCYRSDRNEDWLDAARLLALLDG